MVASIERAEQFLIRESQARAFPQEVQLLSATLPKALPTSSKLTSLVPFFGSDGILHVGGRLAKAPAQRHPILLAAHDRLTLLLVQQAHLFLSHCGPTLLIAHLGERYFIQGVRRLARSVCSQCVVCRKASAKAQTQLMGQLSPSRVSPAHVFATTGMDYAGPFLLKRGYNRRPQIVKAYLAIFICMVTKAVHLEVVSDQTTAALVAALKRFCSRRGRPKDIYSDNGSNFKGAKHELDELTKMLGEASTSGSLHSYLLEGKTDWHFIPERARAYGKLQLSLQNYT